MPSLKKAGELLTPEERVKAALREDGLLVLFRVKNSAVAYSIMNRPEPTLTQVNDHMLATAIVEAVKTFSFARVRRKKKIREKVSRDDGRDVVYKQSIDFDWNDATIKASVGHDLMMQVMSIVVQNLMTAAMRAESAKGGLN